MKGKKIKEAIMGPLMAGTSWMIPFVVAGGIYFSLSVMLNGTIFGTPAQPTTGFLGQLNQIGRQVLLYLSQFWGVISDMR